MTCKKARGFLDSVHAQIIAKDDAAKVKHGQETVLQILEGVDQLIAVRGKNIVRFDLKKKRPDDATLLAHLLGPTGNLRAPAVRIGKSLMIGFNEETYKMLLDV